MLGSFRVEMRDPATLAPSPSNFRRHPDRQRAALQASIEENGWLATILYNERTGHILDGHARVDYACEEGVPEVPVHVINVDERQELRILASFDRIGDLAAMDNETLLSLLKECSADNGLPLGWSGEDLEALREALEPPSNRLRADLDPETLPSEVPARSAVGEIWALGPHRLLCGDCAGQQFTGPFLSNTHVSLVLADPPYNVGLGYDQETDDEKSAAGYSAFCTLWWELLPTSQRIVTPGCSNLALWLSAFRPQAMGVWTKLNSCTRASATRFNCWEPILFWGCKNSSRPHDVFDFPTGSHGGVADHPCPKPVELWKELIKCYHVGSGVVLDPFVGSGTVFIAAEALGAVAFGIEHSAHYCDIILARWELLTSCKPERVGHV